MPQNNKAFWEKKLLGNKVRDEKVARTLRQEQWKVVRVWEHELASPEQVAKKLVKALQA